jgi:trimeric autotransporter adhesin
MQYIHTIQRGTLALLICIASFALRAAPAARAETVGPFSMVKDFAVRFANDGSSYAFGRHYVVAGPYAYFVASTWATGDELWRTDGTEAGTILVKDICPGQRGSIDTRFSHPAAYEGKVYFAADDCGAYGNELWVSDGTLGGTQVFADLTYGPAGSPNSEGPRGFVIADGTLYFSASSSTRGQLFRTGDTSGSLLPTGQTGMPLFALGESLYFADENGCGLKRINNRTLQVFPLRNICIYTSPSTMAQGNSTYFVASDAINGRELWVTNGTVAGTVMVKDINPGPSGSEPNQLTINNQGVLFFSANDGAHGSELWRSDGTAAGTTLVTDLRPGSVGSGPDELLSFNSDIYFIAGSGATYGLWRSNGAAAGTTAIVTQTARIRELTSVGTVLFFITYDNASTANALFRHDTTTANTVLMKSQLNILDRSLVSFSNGVIFYAATPEAGAEPWFSDGTTAGTRQLMDINPAHNGGVFPTSLNVLAGQLVFFGNPGTASSRYALYGSDGSTNGTQQLTAFGDINDGRPEEQPAMLGNTLYF